MKKKYTICSIICVLVFLITCNNFAGTSNMNAEHMVNNEQVSLFGTFKKNDLAIQSASSSIMPPLYGLLLLREKCDSNYLYYSDVQDLGNDCYKETFKRKHCDGGFHYQLTQFIYRSVGSYCGPQKDISYHIVNNETDIIIRETYASAMPIGTSQLLTYKVDSDLKMSCPIQDYVGPTLAEKVFQGGQWIWVYTDYQLWDNCVDAFEAKLPAPPLCMYRGTVMSGGIITMAKATG